MEKQQKDWSVISRIYRKTNLTKNILMGLEEGCYIETDIQYFDKDGNEIPKFGEYVSPIAEREKQWKRIVMSSVNNRNFRVYQKRANSSKT